MLERMAGVLPTAEEVTDRLVELIGPDRLWQVERLGDHTFRGWTTDGRIVLAIVREDGGLALKELESCG